MAQDDWTVPQMETAEPIAPPPAPAYGAPDPWSVQPTPPPQFAYELRPLSLGEILDRTFALFREHFWLFAGIAAITGALNLCVGLLQVLMQYAFAHQKVVLGIISVGGGMVGALVQILGIGVTYATLIFALGEVYLGKTTDVLGATKAVLPKWYRYFGIVIWQSWSAAWVALLLVIPGFILIGLAAAAGGASASTFAGSALVFLGFLGGMVYGVIAYIRNSLAIPATVIEQLPVRASMRRSKDLAAGTKGRIFVVYLIGLALTIAIGTADVPAIVMFIRGASSGQIHVFPMIWLQVVGAVGHTLITPVVLIGLALVYFDQRVRKEALDLVMMMGNPAPLAPPMPPAPPAEPYAYAEAPIPPPPSEPYAAAPEVPAEPPAATHDATEAGPTHDAGSL